MYSYFINEKGQIIPVLLHDCDGTDYLETEIGISVLDEITGELIETN